MTSTATATARPSTLLATSLVPSERSQRAKTLAARVRPASTACGYATLTRESERSDEPMTQSAAPHQLLYPSDASQSNARGGRRASDDEFAFETDSSRPANGQQMDQSSSSRQRRIAPVVGRESTATPIAACPPPNVYQSQPANAHTGASGSGRPRVISAPSEPPAVVPPSHHKSGFYSNANEQQVMHRNPGPGLSGRELTSPTVQLLSLDQKARVHSQTQAHVRAAVSAGHREGNSGSGPAPIRFTALQAHIEAARMRHRAGRPSPSPSLSTISTSMSVNELRSSVTPTLTPRGPPGPSFTPSFGQTGHIQRPPQTTNRVDSSHAGVSPLARPDPSSGEQAETAPSSALLNQKIGHKYSSGESQRLMIESNEHQKDAARWATSDVPPPGYRPHSSLFLTATPDFQSSSATRAVETLTPRRVAAPLQTRFTPVPLSASLSGPTPTPGAASVRPNQHPTTPRTPAQAGATVVLLSDFAENAAVEDSGLDASQSPSDADAEQSTHSLQRLLRSAAYNDVSERSGSGSGSGGTSASASASVVGSAGSSGATAAETARVSDTGSHITCITLGTTISSSSASSSACSPATGNTSTTSSSAARLRATNPDAAAGARAPYLSQAVGLDSLPEPMLVRVLLELDTLSLVRCAGVCRRLRRLVWTAGTLWHSIRFSRAGCASSTSATDHASVFTAAATAVSPRASNQCAADIDADRVLEVVLTHVCAGGDAAGGRAPVRSAYLSGCARLSDRGVGLLATYCAQSLRTLDVSRCPLVSSEALSRLLTSCPRLEAIIASGNARLGSLVRAQDVAFVAGASSPSLLRAAALTHVDVSECRAVDDDAVLELSAQCRALEHLFLRRCVAVGDAGVRAVAAYCARLRSISLCECVRVSDRSLVALFAPPRRLEYVSIASCARASDCSAIALSRVSTRLTYLNVRGVPRLSDRGLVALLERAPCLRSLDAGAGARSMRYWTNWRKADTATAEATQLQQQQLVTSASVSASASASQSHQSLSQLHCECLRVKTPRSPSQPEAAGGVEWPLSDADERLLVEPAGNERTSAAARVESETLLQCSARSLLSEDQSTYMCSSADDADEEPQLLQREGISDTSLVALAQHCPRLERLALSGLSHVTDEGLRWLVGVAGATAASGDASAASAVTPNGGSPSSRCRSRLVYLDVRHCARVTPRGLRRVRALAPACIVEHTLLSISTWCEADELHERGLSADGEAGGGGPGVIGEGSLVATTNGPKTKEGRADEASIANGRQRLKSTRCPEERVETVQKRVVVNV